MVDFTSRYSNGASFSSSLLDAIYRSIDQEEDEVVIYRESTRMEKSYHSNTGAADEEMADFRRARMIEKWMEEKVSEKVVVRRNSAPAGNSRKDLDTFSLSSSDSGSGGGGALCSSFESESFPIQRPKPVRTAVPATVGEILEFNRLRGGGEAERTPKRDGGLVKKKSRALKLYAELKKVKQPISPGGKLAGLLNSLFAGGNSKKTSKISDLDSPSLKSSTCSSASSFSRSCLSKTPSSRGKSEKRSVRFSPVSVIFNDEDFRSSKTQQSKLNLNREEYLMVKNEEMVRDIVEKYHRKNEPADFPIDHLRNSEEEEDDAGSCASSDLFELDNLAKWGMEELPVYETTSCIPNSQQWPFIN